MPRKLAWEEFLPLFLKRYEDRLAPRGTIRNYRYAVVRIFKDFSEGLPGHPSKWEPSDVRVVWDRISYMAPSTQLRYLTVLLMFLRFSGNVKCLDIKLGITPTRTGVDWLEPEQMALLLSTSDNLSIHAAEVIMAYTGMRREEIVTLKMSQISEDHIFVRGKRRKERIVPLTEEFWEAISEYMEWRKANNVMSDNFLVYRPQNKMDAPRPYAVESLTNSLRMHGKRLGFHLTPHTMRRTFGRLLWKNGCKIEIIAEILGHSSVKTTIQYLGINQFDLKDSTQYFPSYRGKMYLNGKGQK